MRKFFVTCSLLVLITIVVLIEYFFSPFKNYGTMSLTAVFFIYWGIEFVLEYVTQRKSYPERFKYFIAETINKQNLDMQVIEQNHKKYYSKFKRSIAGEKWTQILKFCFCFGAALGLIVSMFL